MATNLLDQPDQLRLGRGLREITLFREHRAPRHRNHRQVGGGYVSARTAVTLMSTATWGRLTGPGHSLRTRPLIRLDDGVYPARHRGTHVRVPHRHRTPHGHYTLHYTRNLFVRKCPRAAGPARPACRAGPADGVSGKCRGNGLDASALGRPVVNCIAAGWTVSQRHAAVWRA